MGDVLDSVVIPKFFSDSNDPMKDPKIVVKPGDEWFVDGKLYKAVIINDSLEWFQIN